MFIGSFAPVGVEGFSRHVRQEAKHLVPLMISEFKTIPYDENPVTGMKTIIDEEIVKELVFAQIHRMLIVFGAILEEDKPISDVPNFAG